MRSTKNKFRDTASRTQRNKKGSSEISPVPTPLKNEHKEIDMPVKRDKPSEDLFLCRRLSEDLDEIVSPGKSSLVKRQKLDG